VQRLLARMSGTDVTAARLTVFDRAGGSQGRPFANPYLWAAFQCVGAGWAAVE
jgi:hypothetical protein